MSLWPWPKALLLLGPERAHSRAALLLEGVRAEPQSPGAACLG